MAILDAETGEKHDPELMRIFCGLIESSEFNAASIWRGPRMVCHYGNAKYRGFEA